jgi:hypothetical protein
MLNEYHKQRNKAALEAAEERLKHPASLEQMREQVQRLLNEPEEVEGNDEAEEHKRKVFEISPQRETLLLSLDDTDIQTIVEALEITINNRLASAQASGIEDHGIKRFIDWKDKAKRRHICITTIARHPIINCIRKNLLQLLEDQKFDLLMGVTPDAETLKIFDEKISHCKRLIAKLKFDIE